MASNRFLIRMTVAGLSVLTLTVFLAPTLWPIFQTNPILNGVILGVLLLGTFYTLQQIIALKPELKWLKKISMDTSHEDSDIQHPPKILAPLAAFLTKNSYLSTTSLRTVLDSIDARLQESRDLTRYMVGLLVFLGLLGTFWGLSITIKSVSSVITSLPTGQGGGLNVLDQLQKGLQAPLEGMGVAFSSSLFGLASSLILGFFELQTSQARHHFFKEVEENLTNRVIISPGEAFGNSGDSGSMPAYTKALLEQTAENLEGLQRVTSRNEQERQILNSNLTNLCEKFSALIDQRETEKNLLLKVAEGLVDFQKQLKIFTSKLSNNEFGLDSVTKKHIGSLNEVTHKLLEATSTGQENLAKEVRSEIRVLTKTLNNLASEQATSATA